ncbi:MAG: hypothetical protein ABR962_10760 [Candidatus Bathyarchaeia archaeon]|jgi:ribonuclease HII
MINKRQSLIGVDEAGLGPVFGPLVVAGVRVKAMHLNLLRELGVKDSKLFGGCKRSRWRRELVWQKAKQFVEKFEIRVFPAGQIDSAYLQGITMYDLEIHGVAEILNELDWQTTEAIYLHQLGQTSRNKVLQKLHKHDYHFFSESFNLKTVYEKYADIKYTHVGLASIVAKVTRDTLVGLICDEIGEEYVSGYANRNTAVFLGKYFERCHTLPPHTRRTRNWQPLNELVAKEGRRC